MNLKVIFLGLFVLGSIIAWTINEIKTDHPVFFENMINFVENLVK